MKRLLRITVLFSVTLLWWGEKGYAATPAMDAAEKETVSATVEAEADKKDPKSDKKSDEPKRKRNLGHLSGSFETNTIYYVEDSKTGAVVPHNSYGSNNFLKLDYQLGRFSAGVQLEYYPHPLVGTPMQGYEYVMEGFSINNLTEKYISWTDRNYSVTVGDFYEQFGSGLILRAWEDRALGFNNSLGGARVTFNIKDIVEGKVLYAFPLFVLFVFHISKHKNQVFAFAGRIVSYKGHAKRLATVQPSVRIPTPAGPLLDVPPIIDVPVVFPSTLAGSLLFPVRAGDGVLIIVSEVGIGKWLQSAVDASIDRKSVV